MLQTFWRTLIRFDAEKVTPGTALRNSIGIAIPILAGAAMGSPASGLVACSGALNVAFTDGDDPYLRRATRMIVASIMCGIAVFVGSVSGAHDGLAISITFLWAFMAGMLVAVDQAAADVGLISLVTLIIFAAFPQPVERAALSGLLALSGGLLQTALAVSLWPVRGYEPERRAIASLYRELARAAGSTIEATEAPPATPQISDARKSLTSFAFGRHIQAERYFSLLNQAERIRLSFIILTRLRVRLYREEAGRRRAERLEKALSLASGLLSSIAVSLENATPAKLDSSCLKELNDVAAELKAQALSESPAVAGTMADAVHQLDALAGQLRSALDLAASATLAGLRAFDHREAQKPVHLRLVGVLPTLRANLSLDSAACRHAIRLAVCVACSEAVARTSGWERNYWLPMTAALVLKPDFTATISRGVLRFAGTFAGLLLATALFRFLPPTFATDFILLVIFVFILRCFGGANYGILVTAVSAMVVALLAVSGIPPSEVIMARGLNTAVGGGLALLAYALFPTWERTQLRETLARMVDAYRGYFHAIRESYLRPDEDLNDELDRTRQTGRLARSNLEASVERFRSEPGASPELIAAWNSILASSHRLIHACMALEAGLSGSHPVPAREAFHPFASGVEVVMHSLAGALRGSPLSQHQLPDLRSAHNALLASGDSLTDRYALVNIEADRLTNSLNTLTEQVLQQVSPAHSTREIAAQV